MSSSGSDSEPDDSRTQDQEEEYYEDTGVQDGQQVQAFVMDDNAQDYAYMQVEEGVDMDGVPVQYEDNGEESFDPTEFFNSFARNQQQAMESSNQDEDEEEEQAPMQTDINTDLQVSESESDNDNGNDNEVDNDNDEDQDFVDVGESQSSQGDQYNNWMNF